MMFSVILEKCWPISGRILARNTVKSCVRCYKFVPETLTPSYGKFTVTTPFIAVGLDYVGPYIITEHRGRGDNSRKYYICRFVLCCAIKVVHLELVIDLSAEAFIACFRRFLSQRGNPLHTYSDNATNFMSSNSEIKNIY